MTLNHGSVLWLTGLSGSGKTSLCREIVRLLKPRLRELIVLDGDAIRAAFGGDLTYSEQDRTIQIKRLQSIAKLLAEQGAIVLVAAVYSNPKLLEWNRCHLPAYVEVYVRASMETLRTRDTKGLYASSDTVDVVGVTIPWSAPRSADVEIATDSGSSPEELARRVIAGVPCLAAAQDSVEDE
jgi:adenylylsulfate kinase-like enzyme